MSPWKVLGWLLVALLALLIVAATYGLSLLYGWTLPSGKTLGAVAGGLAGLTLLLWLALALYRRGHTRSSSAPLPVNLPADHLSRWVLLDNGALFPHLPELFQNTGSPVLMDETEYTTDTVRLWSTKGAHWFAVSASTGAEPEPAPSSSDDSAASDSPANNTAKAKKPSSTWDRLLNDQNVRRWLSSPAGIVLCLDMESLSASDGKDAVAHLPQRVNATRKRLGNAPVYLFVTGIERAPGLPGLVRSYAAAPLPGSHSLHAPLGWIMPDHKLWTPVSRWALAGVCEGMNHLLRSLDSLVRCSDAGIPAPGGSALLFENALQPLTMPLAALATEVRFNGVFWVALPAVPGTPETSNSPNPHTPAEGTGIPLFVRDLFLKTLPDSCSQLSFPLVGRRRQIRTACRVAVTLLALVIAIALYRGGERGAALLPRMNQFGESLPQAASIAELDGMISLFRELEHSCSGTVHLYDAPHERLEQLRTALGTRLTTALPPRDDMDRWVNELRLWAETRPGVEAFRLRAPDGTVLANVDGAATTMGRKAAIGFLHDVAVFIAQEDAGDKPDVQKTVDDPAQIRERLKMLSLRYDALTLAAWHAAGQSLLEAVRPAKIDPQTLLPTKHIPLNPLDFLGPNNPCATFLAIAERELRVMDGPVPVWVHALRDMRRIRQLARLSLSNGTSLSETAEFLGEPSGNARQVLGNLDKLLQARAAWADYQSALAALTAETGTAGGLIRLARALYGNDPNNALRVADNAWQGLAAALEARNPDLRHDTLVLSLVRVPLQFAAETASAEAARNLQQRWSTEVIGPVEGMEGEVLQQALIGDDGLLLLFITDAARPFLRPTARGFIAASALGMRFPLSEAFLSLLVDTPQHMTVYPASYPVRMMFTPVTVNSKAKAYPRGLSLRMDCGGEPFRTDVYNYQESTLLNWSPEQCGDLTLAFLFDDFAAEVTYDGSLGFAHFVEQATSGTMTFTPADFSDAQQKLETLGITQLRTRFRIDGAEAVRERLYASPALVHTILSAE